MTSEIRMPRVLALAVILACGPISGQAVERPATASEGDDPVAEELNLPRAVAELERGRDLPANRVADDAAVPPAGGLFPAWDGANLPGRTSGARRRTPNGVEGPDPGRRWNLAVLSGYEYDTNVAIAPAITPLGLGSIGNPRDGRWVVSLVRRVSPGPARRRGSSA